MKVSIATNSIEIKKHLQTIKDYIYAVSISIDGIGYVNDSFRNYPGLFEKVTEAIKLLNEHNVRMCVSTVIWDGNKNQLEDIVKFVKENGVSQINFSYLVPAGRATNDKIHINFNDYKVISEEFERKKSKYNSDNFQVLFRRSHKLDGKSIDCEGGKKIIHIDGYGNIYPCSWCAKIKDNKSFSAQWNGNNMNECFNKIRQLNEIIKKRKEQLGYSGCPAMAYLYYKDLYSNDPLNILLER